MNNSQNEYGRDPKGGARSLYVMLLVILMSVAVVVAVAGSVAKNVKKPTTNTTAVTTSKRDTDSKRADDALNLKEGSETDGETMPDTGKETEPTADDVNDTEPAVAEADVLPTFSAPCGGEIMRCYTGTTPVFSVTMDDWRTHTGIDVYAAAGTEVRSVADGVIKDVWDDAMMGSCISIEHSGGAVSVYKNLSDEIPEWIEKGVSVKAGDTIALAGESALEEIAEENHLHFELQVNGVSVDPQAYIVFSDETSYDE